jgi:acetyl esterase/lipase
VRKHPLASPFYAELKGLPPLLIQTGTAEIILDDSTRFAEKAEKSGVKVILDLWSDMFHVFQIFGNLMPESKKALEKIGDFIKENFS